ncbi:MAG: monovalent cation/H(+) antiporter subunit G [Thermoanaerobaculales bacterium]|nr:monovalent cation/H(+) antiporter subunit G [Thermoanaerobaculales bacterium]
MTGALVAEVLSWVFIVTGSVFVLIGGIGLIRLPDFYTRIHAAGITDTMGAWLILIGLMFTAGWSLVTVKLFMLLFFLAATSPLSSHALAKAAFMRGLEPMIGRDLEIEVDDD